MPTNKKRIIIALDEQYIKQLDELCIKLNTKQYAKVIRYLLEIITIK